MNIDLNDEIFLNIERTLEYLIRNNIKAETTVCTKCNHSARLQLYKYRNEQNIIYRCLKKGCQKRISIFKTKLKFNKYLQLIYLLMTEATYRQLKTWFGYSTNTIHLAKEKLQTAIETYLEQRPACLGGENLICEMDETVLSRRGIIRSPTSLDETRTDTVWILGAVDNTSSKNFFLQRVEFRTILAITLASTNKIRERTYLHTDGYSSYPGVAERLNLIHRVVNHSRGFVSDEGIHTNNIEGFWSHLKTAMRKENGVKRENIDKWLLAYTFKRRYILHSSRHEIAEIFKDILKIL